MASASGKGPSKAQLRSFGTNLPGLSTQSQPIKAPLAKTTVVPAIDPHIAAARKIVAAHVAASQVAHPGLHGLTGPAAKAHKSSGLFSIPGIGTALKVGRAIGTSAAALGEEAVSHPLHTALKFGTNVASAGAGIPVALAAATERAAAPELSAAKAAVTGHNPIKAFEGSNTKTIKAVKRFGGEQAARVSKEYGSAYRGEKGALKKARQDIYAHGPLSRVTDIATGVLPVDALATRNLGKISEARVARGEAPGLIGKVHAGTKTRPGLKVNPLKPAAEQRVRRTLTGTAFNKTVDTARAAAQRRAVRKSELPETSLRHKPLSARRSSLAPGEVAPVSERALNVKLRAGVAKDVSRGHIRAGIQQAQHLVGRGDTIRGILRALPEEQRSAALVAARDGIRDSKAAKTLLARHIDEIKANLHPGAESKNLPLYEKWHSDPSIFDKPEVREAAQGIVSHTEAAVGESHGLSHERAVRGRTDLQAGTLGVQTPEEAAAARAELSATTRAAAKADLNKARTRLTQAAERVARGVETRGPVSEAAHAELTAARDNIKVARARVRRVNREASERAQVPRETADQYRERVNAAAAKQGLEPASFVTTKTDEDRIASESSPARKSVSNPKPLARNKSRTGINYRTGNESLNPETHIKNLMQTIESGTAAGARSDILHREGTFYPSEEAAKADLKKRGIDFSDETGDVSIVPAGQVRKSTGATPATKTLKGGREVAAPGSDAGDFVHSSDFVAIPRAVDRELADLAKPQGKIIRQVGKAQHLTQAAILAASPSWWGFQRLADVIGVGSAGITPARWAQLRTMLKDLDPVTKEEVAVQTGHGISSAVLTPEEPARLSIASKLYAKNPKLRDALEGRHPFTKMIESDAKIVGKNREYITIKKALDSAQGRRLNGDVASVADSIKPLVDAAAKGDAAAFDRLVRDPEFQAHLERGAEATARIMGDFSSMTALEKNAKAFVTFYGFLRFSSRLLFYTLPYEAPAVGLMVYQLGQMGRDDARQIIGDHLPYGLGAFYTRNKDGSFNSFDLSRAFPTGSSIIGIHSPGQIASLFNPVAGIVANQIAGKNLFTGHDYEARGASPTLSGRLTQAATDAASLAAPVRVALSHKPITQLSPVPLSSPTNAPAAGAKATLRFEKQQFRQQLQQAKAQYAKTPEGKIQARVAALIAKDKALGTPAYDSEIAKAQRRAQLTLAKFGYK